MKARNTLNLLERARQAYYHGNSPIMTDAEFDKLEEEYRQLCPDCPSLKRVGAPYDPASMLTRVKHPDYAFNGSQFKIPSPDPGLFLAWEGKMPKLRPSRYHCSLKGDGGSLALYYADGVLVKAISRGDGKVGEDVTANAAKMKGVPLRLKLKFSGQIRCEVVLTLIDWKKVDPSMNKNPRNTGNGIMGRSNGEDSQHLTALATDMRPAGDRWFEECNTPIANILMSETSKFEALEYLGFQTVDWEVFTSPIDVIDWYQNVTRRRQRLAYWIDGVVIRVDNLEAQEKLGITDQRPKGQIAWKFEDEGAETVIREVVLSVGHTGAIIPTGKFEPVEIGGTTVQNALLCNWDEIKRLGIAVGDTVRITKAGDIIPKVTEVLHRPDNREKIWEPRECPVCNGSVDKVGAAHVCQNDQCGAKGLGKIKRWVKSLDILHVGDKLLDALYKDNMVHEIIHLYTISELELGATIINDENGMILGAKRAKTAWDNIQKSRNMTVAQFFGSLGIPHLGKRRAETMIEAVPELSEPDNWMNGHLGSVSHKAGVPEIGSVMDSILRDNPGVRALLGEVNLDTSAPQPEPEISGHTFCITGKLPNGKTKKNYAEPLAAKGHKLVDKVDKNLKFLVLADPSSTSAKATKARKLGITLIGDKELDGYCK